MPEEPQRLKRWRSLIRGPFATLPDFLITGAQKCGTTALYDTIVAHPAIAPAYTKEVHFFDRHWAKGLLWYRANFISRMRRSKLERGGKRIITGEASPSYIYHPLAPSRVKSTLPQARFIVLLRNPVDRAFSHYHMEFRRGIETLSFEEAIATEERLKGLHEKVLTGRHSHRWWHFSYKARGRYAEQLWRWFEHFPREQFLILQTEDFAADPPSTVQRVLEFLGVESLDLPEIARSNIGGYEQHMQPQTRAQLIDYFRPHNQRLEQLLGSSCNWDR